MIRGFRLFLSLLALAVLGCVRLESAKLNVLFLAVDDMKVWVGCLGGYEGKVHTPNIDRLAKRGVLFSNAHCASPKCAPSRAAIMTGLRSSTTGLYDNQHWWYPNFPSAVTLPVHFRNNGYRVAGSGKIFHHTAGNNPPKQWHEFERLLFRDDPWFRGSKLNYPWSKHTSNPEGYPFSGVEGLGHENDWGVLPIADKDLDDVRSADYSIRFLNKKQSQPFFLACGLFRPHLPWYVPERFFDLYPLDQVVVPVNPDHDLDDVPTAGKALAKVRWGDLKAIQQAGAKRRAVQAYLASISFADEQLGRVLDALDASSYQHNTIVVLWSDHGWHLGEKQHWHKSTLWEESTRVPLIISVPGGLPGECKQPASLIDLYPTLTELCGIATNRKLDGVSLVAQLNNPQAKRKPVLVEFRKGNVAVRSEHWRFIRYADGSEELYDHRQDPKEWVNLQGVAEHQPVKKRLAKRLPKRWAAPALTKKSFVFDSETFTWVNRKTGKKFWGANASR